MHTPYQLAYYKNTINKNRTYGLNYARNNLCIATIISYPLILILMVTFVLKQIIRKCYLNRLKCFNCCL